MSAAVQETLSVVAAAIVNRHGQVLVSQRSRHAHQGGLWEFPGGKIETGESAREALCRELEEELGIGVRAARPLIALAHDYPDRRVVLDVWRVDDWHGDAHGREGQAIAWCRPESLVRADFPAANAAIISAVQLPDTYLITPEPGTDLDAFLRALMRSIDHGVRLVQLRAKTLGEGMYTTLAKRLVKSLTPRGVRVLLNADPRLVAEAGASGVHLDGRRLHAEKRRPLGDEFLVAASCHDALELARAEAIGVDFVVLSPVQATASHPRATPLGWTSFAELTSRAGVPVYALGGMRRGDLPCAWRHGAQGIAAIGGLWSRTCD